MGTLLDCILHIYEVATTNLQNNYDKTAGQISPSMYSAIVQAVFTCFQVFWWLILSDYPTTHFWIFISNHQGNILFFVIILMIIFMFLRYFSSVSMKTHGAQIRAHLPCRFYWELHYFSKELTENCPELNIGVSPYIQDIPWVAVYI